jgi:hypothetical protein
LPVSINDGLINVVWVKSANRGSPLLVTQFKLKDETKGVVALPPPPEAVIPKEVTHQEPSKPEQPTQMPQQETSKPEEAVQGNKPEASTEQPVQPPQLESIKSELPTQEFQPEVPRHEEPSQSDNNQSSIPKEISLQEPPKTEQQHQVHLIQAIQRRQLETSKLEQSIQTQHNEGPFLIRVGLPEEKVTAQIEAERISKIGKTMLKIQILCLQNCLTRWIIITGIWSSRQVKN